MKLIFRILIRFSCTLAIAIILASYACYRSYQSYWNQTIRKVQTIDFNILAHTLPTKLSYVLINNDLEELQRTLNSNYGYFGLVVTNCLSVEKLCPHQKIIHSTDSQDEWKKRLNVESLTENIPYSILRNPPPLLTEFQYNSSRDENPNTIGNVNQGQVIGRVYYIRGIPPQFSEDIRNWWSKFPTNLFNEKNAGKYYGVISLLFLLGGLGSWVTIEDFCLRNRKEKNKLLLEIKEGQRKLREQDELNANDIKNKDLEISDLNHDLQQQQEIVEQKEREKQEIKRDYQQFQLIHSQYKKELEQIINSRENAIQALEEQNIKLVEDLELKRQRINLDKSQIEDYKKIEKTIIENRNQLDFLKQDLAKHKEKISIKENEYIAKESEYQENIAFLEQESQRYNQKINSLEQRIKDKNHQLKKLENERDDLQNQIANLNVLNLDSKKIQQELQKLKVEEINQLKEENEYYKNEIYDLEYENHKLGKCNNIYEQEINRLETKNIFGMTKLSSINNDIQGSHIISLNITEKDFYIEESKDLILDILKKSLNNLHEDSRRQHIVSDIIKHNHSNSAREEIKQKTKDIFGDYKRMTNEKRKELEKIGFEFISDSNHYKLRFKEDPRYQFSCSKTPSDQRSGRNLVREIRNKLF
ncbi:MAG: hypothetical protein QNJ55_16380 [Xenococcus sp. MO_188.B8]|nr:hypothetical protein [Xenococcus sp. MO_188.B8]